MGLCVVYYFVQERIIFVPTLPSDAFTSKIPFELEEFYIDGDQGGNIHSILVKAREPKGLIFYLHGNTGSIKRWQFMAGELADFGFDVFVIDYRGYGQSRGIRSEDLIHSDVARAFDFIREKYQGSPIVIYGRSLGSGFATKLASQREAHALILETPYFNLIDVARRYMPILPIRLLLRYQLRSDKYINQVRFPVHIFHGTKDKVVPYSSALKLYRKASNKALVEMTTIVGGKHSNLNSFPLFREKLKSALDQVG